MRSITYHLHAVCIHDGNATSGHYYTFINDRIQKKWRRFNDLRVSDATEEEVFNESSGGDGWKTAYWVVYVNDDIEKELRQNDIHTYKPNG